MVDKFFQIQRDIRAKREEERLVREALIEMKKEKLVIKRTLVRIHKGVLLMIEYNLCAINHRFAKKSKKIITICKLVKFSVP